MQADTNMIQLLMEIGYLASGYGFHKEAHTIFKGVRAARPESEFPFIGMAVVKMNQGESDEAIGILNDYALAKNPESDLVKSFMGLALKLSGENGKSREILMQISPSSGNQAAVDMARELLTEMNA